MRIVCIGSGNLATNLTLAWKEAGILVEQVFSRTEANAKALAGLLGCAWTVSIEEIINDADLYLFSLKDSALETVASRLPENSGLWVHTAGSMPLAVFEPFGPENVQTSVFSLHLICEGQFKILCLFLKHRVHK